MTDLRRLLRVHLTALRRRRRCLENLISDREHAAQPGNWIVYCVDYSEVYSFLFRDRLGKEVLSFGTSIDDADTYRSFSKLALEHLFHGFAPTVYLLPPHLQELLWFSRTEAARFHDAAKLRSAAASLADELDPVLHARLQALHEGAEEDDEGAQSLIAELGGRFAEIWDEVCEFVRWSESETKLDEIRTLVHDGALSYSVEEAANVFASGSFRQLDKEEVLRVFGLFSSKERQQKMVNRLQDARSLVMLRTLNRLAEPAGGRVLLVTRDANLRRIARKLSASTWFGWRTCARHLRSTESVFLDLVVNAEQSREDQVHWLVESQEVLHRLEESVDPKSGVHTRESFMATGEGVLKEAWEDWATHVNLRLSLAVSRMPRYDAGQPRAQSGVDAGPNGSGDAGADERLTSLRRFSKFLNSPEYREPALRRAEELLDGIFVDAARMQVLDEVGEESAERIHRFFSQRFALKAKTVLRFGVNWSLQFVSQEYTELLRGIAHSRDRKGDGALRLANAFYSVVDQAVARGQEAEDFLFMSFVLGMSDQWEPALRLAELAAGLPGEISGPELKYFTAIAHRRVVGTEDHSINHHFPLALELLEQAATEKRKLKGETEYEDPRFLKELATIALSVEEHRRVAEEGEVTAHALTDLTLRQARRWLIAARKRVSSDRRLRIDILNNLVCVAYLRTPAKLTAATRYLARIDQEFRDAEDDPELVMPRKKWPALLDSEIYVHAIAARDGRDEMGLAQALESLNEILADGHLSVVEARWVRRHRDAVRRWLDELRAA